MSRADSPKLDHLLVWINGRRHEVRGRNAFLSLSDYLRCVAGLVGTKIVCSEGDCGACSVLIGRPTANSGQFVYRPVDACIQFMFQLDGTHVVTIEGLGDESDPSLVQQAMIECHGSQCGFCTPGFVVAMTAILEERQALDEASMRCGLTGNLCRCTGYTPIFDAGSRVDFSRHEPVDARYPSAAMQSEFAARQRHTIEVRSEWDDQQHLCFSPPNLSTTLAIMAEHPDVTIVAGATDLGVRINKSQVVPRKILDLNRVDELTGTGVEHNEMLIGARASWTAIEKLAKSALPEFHRIISIFGAPQIRHVGTIGGNIINASPIADSLPLLHVMDARLELQSARGMREVNINHFYKSYKKFDLRRGELLTRVRIPLSATDDQLRLYKVSRRRDLDIATFTAALRIRVTGETITGAAIAFGGVGPIVIRPRQTESFLRGKPFDIQTMSEAGNVAVDEIRPISDVRGAADYRTQLTRNILVKFFHESRAAVAAV